MAKALIALADGFEDIEAFAAIDVLRRGGIEVVTASVHDRVEVLSAHDVVIGADALLKDALKDDYDAIVLPGGGQGTENLRRTPALLERLVQQREEGRLVCAICAAPTILAQIGILAADQHATCYPSCAPAMNCVWVDQPVVEHDGVITGRAPGSATLFALAVLRALAGDAVAQDVARGMVFNF